MTWTCCSSGPAVRTRSSCQMQAEIWARSASISSSTTPQQPSYPIRPSLSAGRTGRRTGAPATRSRRLHRLRAETSTCRCSTGQARTEPGACMSPMTGRATLARSSAAGHSSSPVCPRLHRRRHLLLRHLRHLLLRHLRPRRHPLRTPSTRTRHQSRCLTQDLRVHIRRVWSCLLARGRSRTSTCV